MFKTEWLARVLLSCSYIFRILTCIHVHKYNLHFFQVYLESILGFSQETLCLHNKTKMKKSVKMPQKRQFSMYLLENYYLIAKNPLCFFHFF